MAFDVGSIVAELKADITNFQKGMKTAKGETDGLKQSLSKVGDSIASFGKQAAVMTGVAAAGIGLVAKKAIDMAGNFEQSEIAFTTLLKDREKAIAAIKEIEKDAKQTPYNLPDLIKANQLLVSAGVNTDDARTQIKNLGNAIAATGGGTDELNRMAVNLQQIKAVGKAAAIDVKQFAFAGINIYEVLAKSTGKNVDEVREMEITYEMLTKALADASGAGGMFEGAMESQSHSLQGLVSNIQDVIGITLKDIAVNSGLFDGIKSGAQGVLSMIENMAPKVERVFTVLGNVFNYLKETLAGNDLKAELEEALGFFFGDQAGAVSDFLIGLMGILKQIGDWISENQELVMTFLQGMGIALGVLMIVGTITALLTALLNPITLVALAVAALYTAWKTNFLGIQDKVRAVVTWMVEFWQNYLAPAIAFIKDYFVQNWDAIKTHLENTWNIIKGIIQIALAIVEGFIKISLAAISGDWGQAWTAIKEMVSKVWDGIKNIFSGILGHIGGWGKQVLQALVKPFEDAWNKISELVNKIKDAVDFTKRNSPSVIDIIHKGVNLANKAFDDLNFNFTGDVQPQALGAAITNGNTGVGAIALNLDLSGAIISSDLAAQELSETIGDNIIKKLQSNIRV